MKNLKTILWLAIASLALLAQAVAQTATVRVSVPFNFSVANRTLPAGDYHVSINGSLLRVTSIEGTGSVSTMTAYVGGGPNQDLSPRLVFHRYGDRRFLTEIWIGETNMGHQLFTSAGELEYARTTKQESVVVSAMR